MQLEICTLCQSVKSNTITLRMQLKTKCRDLSVRSAALPISKKHHIHPEDATQVQMQKFICTLSQSVKSNTLTVRMQLEIKCKDLSVCSANQWKATHSPWGCNSRSNAEIYLYAKPISEKQHINPKDSTWDQMQRLICMLCQSVKINASTQRMQLKIKCRDLSVRSANQWKATHPPWGSN